MKRKKALSIAICSAAVLCACGWVVWAKLRPKPGPMHVALWYWHTPFEVPGSDRTVLKSLGIDTLFVRAATITIGDRVTMMLPQTWKSKSAGLKIHLVFPFDLGMIRHFADLDNATTAADVARVVQSTASRAETAGVHVQGVQFDFDCPTRLLAKYADLVHRCRQILKKRKWEWSVTGLPTWLSSRDVRRLCDEVDFIVPQYYEGAVGKSLPRLKSIAEPATIEDGMARAGRLGTKFWVGLPSYGRAYMFDDRGALLGVYRGLSVHDALRHPSFQFERTYSAVEDVVVLRAIHAAPNGKGLGYRLVYLLPTPEVLAQQIETVRKERPASCQGIVLFRYPEVGQSMCLPFDSVRAALWKEPVRPAVETGFSAKRNPWGLIDTGRRAEPGSDVSFYFKLGGNTPTAASDDAIEVLLKLDRPGIEWLEPGDFDKAQAGWIEADGSFSACGMARATAVRLVRFHMLPGETAKLGALETSPNGATAIEGEWRLKISGGTRIFRDEIRRHELKSKGR